MAIVAVGTELVQCARISQMIARHGEQFLERVFTTSEIVYCSQRPDSTGCFSRRWAAKQAVFKALRCHHRGIRWTDIEIVNVAGQVPHIQLHGAAEQLADDEAIDSIHLSLGGCRTQAIAYVVFCDED